MPIEGNALGKANRRRKEKAALALALGLPQNDAAAAARVRPRTIRTWLAEDPDFVARIQELSDDDDERFKADMDQARRTALSALQRVLDRIANGEALTAAEAACLRLVLAQTFNPIPARRDPLEAVWRLQWNPTTEEYE